MICWAVTQQGGGYMADEKNCFLLSTKLLQRKEVIAEIFGVNPETVTTWAKEGAPIFLVGNMYQADYHALVEWLRENRPASKNLSSTPLPPL
jgi:hypothetical protein